MTPGSP